MEFVCTLGSFLKEYFFEILQDEGEEESFCLLFLQKPGLISLSLPVHVYIPGRLFFFLSTCAHVGEGKMLFLFLSDRDLTFSSSTFHLCPLPTSFLCPYPLSLPLFPPLPSCSSLNFGFPSSSPFVFLFGVDKHGLDQVDAHPRIPMWLALSLPQIANDRILKWTIFGGLLIPGLCLSPRPL